MELARREQVTFRKTGTLRSARYLHPLPWLQLRREGANHRSAAVAESRPKVRDPDWNRTGRLRGQLSGQRLRQARRVGA